MNALSMPWLWSPTNGDEISTCQSITLFVADEEDGQNILLRHRSEGLKKENRETSHRLPSDVEVYVEILH